MPPLTPEMRLERDVAYEPMSGCWLWIGHRDAKKGYGRFRVGQKRWLEHRFFYERARGPIPDGLTIDHLCRVRPCVNPAHMEVVTVGVNVLRGEGPAAVNARREICRRGHSLADAYRWNERGTIHRQCRHCHALRERRRKGKDVPHST